MGIADLKHFDGSDRAPKPAPKELLRGAAAEFIAMALFVFFGVVRVAPSSHSRVFFFAFFFFVFFFALFFFVFFSRFN